MRRKLAPHDIKIHTVRRHGFVLAKEARDRIQQRLAEQGIPPKADTEHEPIA